MRIDNEEGKAPMRLPETGQYAVEDDTPENLLGAENRAPDRRGKITLDQIFPAQEIVSGVRLPVACLGVDGPVRGLASSALRTVDGGSELIQPAELAQFGSEHAVVLRQAARIVPLHIYDVAAFNAHCKISPTGGRTISGRGSRQALFGPPGSARDGRFGKCENRLATKAIGSSNARAPPGSDTPSLNVERRRTRRLATGVGGHLVDPRFRLS